MPIFKGIFKSKALNPTIATLQTSIGRCVAIEVAIVDFRLVFDLHRYYLAGYHRLKAHHH